MATSTSPRSGCWSGSTRSAAASSLEVPFRHLVMPVLFRTIYACGLRCSEARLLRVEDVDINTGVLQVRDAKGGKDRQLPVSEPLRERLAGYHAKLAGQPGCEWFSPAPRWVCR